MDRKGGSNYCWILNNPLGMAHAKLVPFPLFTGSPWKHYSLAWLGYMSLNLAAVREYEGNTKFAKPDSSLSPIRHNQIYYIYMANPLIPMP